MPHAPAGWVCGGAFLSLFLGPHFACLSGLQLCPYPVLFFVVDQVSPQLLAALSS